MAKHTYKRDKLQLDQIIERIRQGDTEAIGDLYKYYYSKLLAQAYYYCGDEEKAKDAVQETFLKVIKKLDKIETNLGAYLMKTLSNSLKTTYRRNKLHQEKISGRGLPSQYVMKEEIDAQLLGDRMKQCLNEEQLKAILMKGEGYSIEEIARELNKSEVNTRQIIYTGRRLLKQDPLVREILWH